MRSSTLTVTAEAGAAAQAMAWRFRGDLNISLIVKASFAFAPGAAMPLVDPQDIFTAEVHHQRNPARTVRFTTDLVPRLRLVDVVFTGRAHAPEGRPQSSMPVRLCMRDGDRPLLDKTLLLRKEAGFTELPLVYEHAFGGLGRADNPMGVGADFGAGTPSIMYPDDPQRVAGFGPIARAWGCRKRLLGGTPRSSLVGPIAEIPDGFDWTYFQAAPADQRLDALQGDEWIVLFGLHPTLPCLETRLPGARARATIHGLSAHGIKEGAALDLAADTLRIDGDEQRCTLTFRGSFRVPSEAALSAARLAARVELPSARQQPETLMGSEAAPRAALPFRPAWRVSPHSVSSGAQEPRAPTGTLVQSIEQELTLAPRRATPFDAPAPPPPPPPIHCMPPSERGAPVLDEPSAAEVSVASVHLLTDEPVTIARAAPAYAGTAPPEPLPRAEEPRRLEEPRAEDPPWAPPFPPPAQPAPPARQAPPPEPPAPPAALKKNVYGRYAGKR